MKANSVSFKRLILISGLAFGLFAAGCAGSASNSATAQNAADPASPGFKQAALKSADSATQVPASKTVEAPAPRVQDCGIVAISSPPKYVCNGKVYTATQLAKLRADEAKKYQSGK